MGKVSIGECSFGICTLIYIMLVSEHIVVKEYFKTQPKWLVKHTINTATRKDLESLQFVVIIGFTQSLKETLVRNSKSTRFEKLYSILGDF